MGTVHAKEVVTVPRQQRRKHEIEKKMPQQADIDLKAVTVKVERINVTGVGRTKNDILVKHLKGIFEADNFQEMITKAQEAKLTMEGMGLFKRVSLFVDVSKGATADNHGYELTFSVKEHGRFAGGISTLVGTNDGSVMFNLRLPNIFGRAERLNGEYSYGTKHAVGLGLNFMKPLQGDPNLILNTGVFQQSGDYPWSGYSEASRGGNASLSFPTVLGQHTLSWEAVWREVSALNKTTAFAVREQAGHSLKSALKHEWSYDKRDSRVLPTEGLFIKSTQELAGVGGDVDFIKQDLQLQYNKLFLLDTVFQVSLAGGLMRPIKPDAQLKLPDKFYIGGPLTLRGFNIRGCGPHSEGCAIGADTYWQATAHLYTPLPFRPGKGGFGDYFKTHLFINTGNLMNINLKEPWKTNLVQLSESLRWSYGAGIVMRMGSVARLELNYCVPMKALATDSVNPGLQFGIGVHFL